MKKILLSSLSISLFLFSGSVFAADIFVTPPLSFQSHSTTPAIPSTIPLGSGTNAYNYTLKNNTFSVTMTISASITGSPSGDAVIDPTSACLTSTLAPNATCTLTVNIDPTTLGAANFTVSANYATSNFQDVTANISYTVTNTYAYITNSGDDTVAYCLNSTGGALASCTDSGVGAVFSGPVAVAVPNQDFSGVNYAYVVNQSSGAVSQCEIDAGTGEFVSCLDSGAGSIFSQPLGISFNETDSVLYAYVTDASTGDITQCITNSLDGTLSSCQTALALPLSQPIGVTFQTIGGTTYAYMSNNGASNESVTQCEVDSTSGEFINCLSTSNILFNSPKGLGFYTANNLHVYVADPTFGATGDVRKCPMNANGSISNDCVSAALDTPFNLPVDIIFQTIGGTDYAYVTNHGNNTVSYCTISTGVGDADGLLDCTDNVISFGLETSSASVYSFNSVNYIYTADFVGGSISQCQIGSGGKIYCLDSGVGEIFDRPTAPIFNLNADTNTYAYVMSQPGGASTVFVCTTDAITGQLTGCNPAGPNGFNDAIGIDFGVVDGVSYAYVTDSYLGVFQCEVQVGGGLNNCIDASTDLVSVPYDLPAGIRFETFSGQSYIYLVDLSEENVFQCALDSTTGLFTSCVDSGAGNIFSSPFTATFQSVSGTTYAYVTNIGSHSVTQCTVDSTTGVFSDCVEDTDVPPSPLTIAFDTEGGVLSAYIAWGAIVGGFDISQCPVANDGSLGDCVTPFGNPLGMAIQTTSGGDSIAYIAQNGGSGVVACFIDNTLGFLNSCMDSGAGFAFPSPITLAFQTVNSITYAYVVDTALDATVQCVWDDSTGLLSGCTQLAPSFSNPTGISFDTVGGTLYAYVANSGSNLISQCTVDPTTGVFNTCSNTADTVFAQPASVTFANNLAYVTDATNNTVVACYIDSAGLLNGCRDSGVGSSFLTPATTAFFTDLDDVLNAYVTNYNSSVSLPGQSVVFCAVNTDPLDVAFGTFSNCADSGVGAAFNLPAGIAFQNYLFDSYAYVTNNAGASNSVSLCTLNDDGSFDVCADSGAGSSPFNQPAGMAFFTL